MSSLKQKTVSGLIWSFVDTMAGQGITFIVGIILARLLSPREFGLKGIYFPLYDILSIFAH
jgi:O-antigen/teichoic acid export membrane protein